LFKKNIIKRKKNLLGLEALSRVAVATSDVAGFLGADKFLTEPPPLAAAEPKPIGKFSRAALAS